MNIIKNHIREKIVVLKSIFICDLFYVETENDIKQLLKDIKKEFYDARHHCYAYILGNNGQIKKCSDDGEPSKTAGAPILNILEKNELTNVLAVVTRYFGGTLLGTGGLVRAYSNATLESLKSAIIEPVIAKTKVTILCLYKDFKAIEQLGYEIINQTFQADIYLELSIPTDDVERAVSDITKITNGSAKILY